MKEKPYTKMTADVYDAIYSKKDYASEAAVLKRLIARYKKSGGNQLLDVACGTGIHLSYLIDEFEVTGVDLSERQLAAARKRLPGLTFATGDMRDFDLRRQFDVVTCLFSSIGYVHPYGEFEQAIKNMSRHLKPGGVLIIEPWLQPDVFNPKRPPHTEVGELPEKQIKVTRTAHNSLEGNISVLKMEHVVESPEGREEFVEEHRLALYAQEDFKRAFVAAGLAVHYEEKGLSNRGLYIAAKPEAITN